RAIFGVGGAAQREIIACVLRNVYVWLERVGLEHDGNVAVLGGAFVAARPADADLAFGDLFEAGDHPEQRALAAARRPDQHDELAIADGEVDPVQHPDVAKILPDVPDVDGCHSTQPSTAPPP